MKYKLLKDTPVNKAGEIFILKEEVIYGGNCVYEKAAIENPGWFAPFCFTTQDGVDMFAGENYYYIDYANRVGIAVANSKSEATLPFSTKKAAENYLLYEEAKKKYPIGTKVKCLMFGLEIIEEHSPHGRNIGYDEKINEIWFKGKSCNILVYKKGVWAEIVPQFEVGKWYFHKKAYIKYDSSETRDTGSIRIVGETINVGHNSYQKNGYWGNRDFIDNAKLLTDLSVIQPYLPKGHVDKIEYRLGDFVTLVNDNDMLGKKGDLAKISGTSLPFIEIKWLNSAQTDGGYYADRFQKATHTEIIDCYKALGWVKGAKFKTKHGNIFEVSSLHFGATIRDLLVYFWQDCETSSNKNISECELIKEPNYPKSWEEISYRTGYYYSFDRCGKLEINAATPCDNRDLSKQVFRTEEQVESALAFAQLSQLVAEMNGDWQPDWTDLNSKYVIIRIEDRLEKRNFSGYFSHLAFKSRELMDFSFEHHKELWEQYWQL